jgi:hypothetical protein
MASATFEDHPTDPDKMILRKPRLDQGADYERGFIDGMQYQMQSSVDKAVNAMSQRTEQEPKIAFNAEVVGYIAPQRSESSGKPAAWVGLTDEEVESYWGWEDFQCGCGKGTLLEMVREIEAALKERNT